MTLHRSHGSGGTHHVETAEFRTGVVDWLDEHLTELEPPFVGAGTLDEQMVQLSRVKRALYDAGWMRWGWPESVGGLGGPSILRAVLGEEVTARGLVEAGFYSMTEVLAPTLAEFAPADLARAEIPKLLRGDTMWCQGFSEPGTGSDLSSLSCRATPVDEHWVVNGQKLWTSLAHHSTACVLLTRTGPPGSAHRGITAFFVDMDTPGITVRPFELLNGAPEFAEVFFDDVVVPADHILGEVNGGWAVAMHILPFERSTSFWHRTAFLARRMQQLVDRAPDDVHSATVLGEAFQQLYAMRARSRLTQYRLTERGTIGPETSVDKILVATAEQQVFDAVRELLPGVVELDDSPDGEHWRSDYLFSRAATIYGGSAEIQRNIVARRLLDLGPENSFDGDAVEARPDGRDAATESTRVMEADELELLDKSVRHALASEPDADDALEAIGWSDVLAAEPRDAVSVVFGALGDLNAVASALDDVMLDALGVGTAPGSAVALPAFGRWQPPGTIRDGDVEIDGLALARVARRDTVAVPARDADRIVVAIVPTAAVDRTTVGGLAPELGMSRLRADAVQPVTIETLAPAAWDDALLAGRRALATELVATGRVMLRLAREHALERVQFGRPIAQFQAVRHRLAETHVALEAADAAVVSAWDAPDPLTAMLAKSLAGRATTIAARHCQQVLAGIGFTAEHALHHYIKRALVLDGLLGSSSRLPQEIGSTLLATRQLPRLLDL